MTRKSTFLTNTGHAAGRFLADERGTTAIEYALIASGIGAAIVSIVFGLGNTVLSGYYTKVSNGLN